MMHKQAFGNRSVRALPVHDRPQLPDVWLSNFYPRPLDATMGSDALRPNRHPAASSHAGLELSGRREMYSEHSAVPCGMSLLKTVGGAKPNAELVAEHATPEVLVLAVLGATRSRLRDARPYDFDSGAADEACDGNAISFHVATVTSIRGSRTANRVT